MGACQYKHTAFDYSEMERHAMRRQGFTLVELLVVIAIIGLLVALLHLPLVSFDLAAATMIRSSPPDPAVAGAPQTLVSLHCLLTV